MEITYFIFMPHSLNVSANNIKLNFAQKDILHGDTSVFVSMYYAASLPFIPIQIIGIYMYLPMCCLSNSEKQSMKKTD